MTALHFIEAIIGIWWDYGVWFALAAPFVSAAGFYYHRRFGK